MKKISLLSIVLILTGFTAATAQNIISEQKKFGIQKITAESIEVENLRLRAAQNANTSQDWWEPDTVYTFSFITPEECRTIFRYNSQGLLTVSMEQLRINNSWENSIQTSHTYDANNNLLTILVQNWVNNSWINSEEVTYTYDNNNNMLTRFYQAYSWGDSDKITRTYDSNNNVITDLYERWEYNILATGYYDTYTYDSNNNMQLLVRQSWLNDVWMYIYRATYTYDSNNNMLTELGETVNGVWENAFLNTFTYDSNNNMLTQFVQRWVNGDWVNGAIYTLTYDSNNNLLTKLYEPLEYYSSLESDQPHTYTYDSNNNTLTFLRQKKINNLWVSISQYLWTYDENGNGASAEYWQWTDESWQPFDTSLSSFSISLYYNNMQSELSCRGYKATASYIKTTGNPNSIEDISLSTISIYPNPTTGLLNITSGEQNIQLVSIYSLSGAKMFSTQDTILDISHLAAGIYFVRITTNKGMITKKIVKM